MHQTGDEIIWLRIAVVLHALNQRTGAVAHAYDGYTDFLTRHTCVPFLRCLLI